MNRDNEPNGFIKIPKEITEPPSSEAGHSKNAVKIIVTLKGCEIFNFYIGANKVFWRKNVFLLHSNLQTCLIQDRLTSDTYFCNSN